MKTYEVDEIDTLTAHQLVDLLNAGYVVQYNQKQLYPPDDDMPYIVWGVDAYGCDFGAGDIRTPENVLDNLKGQTLSERHQEAFL